METQDEYLDRICGNKKTKLKRKPKDARSSAPSGTYFGYTWDEIQAMQTGTYKRRIVK